MIKSKISIRNIIILYSINHLSIRNIWTIIYYIRKNKDIILD